MEKIPTSREFMKGKNFSIPSIEEMIIEFAKLHVEAALKEASEKAVMKDLNEDCHYEDEDGSFPDCLVIDRDSILNSYPLSNIK